jgi:hypothetical protein
MYALLNTDTLLNDVLSTASLHGVEWDEVVINRDLSPSHFFLLQTSENIGNRKQLLVEQLNRAVKRVTLPGQNLGRFTEYSNVLEIFFNL